MADAAAVDTTAKVAERVIDKVMDKTGNFVDAAASAAGNIFEAASNIVQTAVEKYGQSVVDAVLWVVRLDAIQILVTSLVILVFCLSVLRWMWTGFQKRDWKNRIHRSSDDTLYIPICIVTALLVFIIPFEVVKLTNVWTYTAVFKPELYLAKQAVDIVKARLEPQKK